MAFYKMQSLPDMRGEDIKTTYPRMTGGRVVTTDELAARVSEESTFSAGEVKGILASVCKYLAWYMRDGDRVKVDGLGTFSASLGMADDAEPEVPGVTRRNARSVRVRGVNLRADKQLVYEITGPGAPRHAPLSHRARLPRPHRPVRHPRPRGAAPLGLHPGQRAAHVGHGLAPRVREGVTGGKEMERPSRPGSRVPAGRVSRLAPDGRFIHVE